MAFLMKNMLSAQVKNLGFGSGKEENQEENPPSDPAAAAGMTREEYEEYQKQVVEEKMERDAAFAQKKAERAYLRLQLRAKYRLPKSEQDENQIQLGGEEVDLPDELGKMVMDDQAEEEEEKDSLLDKFRNVDLEELKEKARGAVEEMKRGAGEKCSIM
ncbi:CPLX4 protein, partial [Rhynochetos jubatus]|nr:CPLX4 protein [Rhynochetos jubatus]